MKKMLLIVNPAAGKMQIRTDLLDILRLFAEKDYTIEIRPTLAPKDAQSFVKQHGQHADLIVCAGGDGTLDEVMCGMMESGLQTPLGYIPCGTTNDYAKSLGIPFYPMEAAKQILQKPARPIDIGKFEAHYFSYVAAFGAFTQVSYSTPQEFKNMMGNLAYIMEGIKSLPNIRPSGITIRHDGGELSGEYIYGMISNSTFVGGMKSPAGKTAAFDDGLFEVLLVKEPKSLYDINQIAGAFLLNEINENYMVSFKTAQIDILSDEAVDWTLDGEFGGTHKAVHIQNLKQALSLIF